MRYDGFQHELQCGGDTIKFDAKPPSDVLAALKANGFRWNPQRQTWWRRRVGKYADLLAWIDRKLHPNRPDGACWDCKAPDGFFRPDGPAAPVLCCSCHAKRQQKGMQDAVA